MSDFFNAVKNGDLELVKTQLSMVEDDGGDADIAFSEHGNVNALYLAVQNGHYHIVEYLLSKGAKTNISYEQSKTILHIAVESPDPKILGLLLQHDALQPEQMLDQADASGATSLHLAVKLNKLEIVRLLIRAGANSASRDQNGHTALNYSAALNASEDDDGDNNDINQNEDATKIKILLQSAEEWNREFAGLSLPKIMHYLDCGLPGIANVKNNDIFLVIGNTGSGKSTLINYVALDVAFKKSKITDLKGVPKPIPIDESKVGAKIGYSMSSETITAALYQGNGLNLLDVAGFIDNRGETLRVIVSMNTRIAIQQARKIGGVTIVIDVASLEADKGKGLIELSKTLGQIFKDPFAIKDSLFFAYTKAGSAVSIDNILDVIKKVRQAQLQSVNEIMKKLGIATGQAFLSNAKNKIGSSISSIFGASNNSNENTAASNQNSIALAVANLSEKDKILWREVEQVINILDLMRDRSEYSTVVNLFTPASRDRIQRKFMTAPDIDKEQLNFGAHDDIQGKFDRAMFKVAENANRTMGRLLDLNTIIANNRKEVSELEDRIIFYEQQIEQFKTNANKARQITEIKNKIAQNKQRIYQLRGDSSSTADNNDPAITTIGKLHTKITTAENDIKKLDTNVLTTLWTESFSEKRSALGFFGWSEKKFAYSGENGFDRTVVKSQEGGAFSEEKIEPQNGIYQVKYQSNFYQHAEASVKLNIATKLKDPHPATIKEKKLEVIVAKLKINGALSLQKEIDNLDQASKNSLNARLTIVNNRYRLDNEMSLQERIDQFTTENERFIGDLGALETSEMLTQQRIEERIQEMVIARNNLQARRNELNTNLISLQNEKNILTLKATENLSFYSALYKLTSIVTYDQLLVQQFRTTYKQYTENTEPAQMIVTNPEQDLILCPISQEVMVDPVRSVDCGHSFDLHSILAYANSKRNDVIECPCCRKPINVKTDLQPNRDLKEIIGKRQKESAASFSTNGLSAEEIDAKIISLTQKLSVKEEAHRQLQLGNTITNNPELLQLKLRLESEINLLSTKLRALDSGRFIVQLQANSNGKQSESARTPTCAATSSTSTATTSNLPEVSSSSSTSTSQYTVHDNGETNPINTDTSRANISATTASASTAVPRVASTSITLPSQEQIQINHATSLSRVESNEVNQSSSGEEDQDFYLFSEDLQDAEQADEEEQEAQLSSVPGFSP